MPFSFARLKRLPHLPRPETRLTALIVSVSIANLCYLRLWDALLHHPERDYLAATPDRPLDYVAALGGMLVLTLAIYAVIRVLWHNQNRVLRAGAMIIILVFFVFPADFVRRSSGTQFEAVTGVWRFVLIGVAALALVGSAALFRQRFYAALFWCFGILSPFVVVNIWECVAAAWRADGQPAERPYEAIHFPQNAPGRRVVWVLFDEWDQTVLTEKRPPGLQLPNLDALRRESVVATQAFAPAGVTRLSVPALLSGQVLTSAFAEGADTLQVKLAGATSFRSFRELPSVADDAAALRMNFSAIGWYHPYGRLFADEANAATKSYGYPAFQAFRKDDFFSAVLGQLLFLTSPTYGRHAAIELYQAMHAEALRCVADPTRNVIFLHYGIPHYPGIFNARTGELSTWLKSEVVSYMDNLVLVDRTLGELLAAIDRAGLRDSTSVVFTSDHWWRSAPWAAGRAANPVPLIIQVGGDRSAIVANAPLVTTCLRAMVRALLVGQLRDNAAVAEFLGKARISGRVRYVDAAILVGR